MKNYIAYIISGLVIAGLVVYFVFTGQNSSAPTTATPPVDNSGGATPPTSTTPPTTSAGFKDGTFTGPVTDAIYGKIQVAVTISGGKITDISWPVYPDSHGETSQISQRSLPTLKQEVIASQSANVNDVSGATQTSDGFKQSLSAALAQAKA
jgi:uncharacterized protein with FMN-binding domain